MASGRPAAPQFCIPCPSFAAACVDDVKLRYVNACSSAADNCRSLELRRLKARASPAGYAIPLTAGWWGPGPSASGAQRGGSAAGQPYVASTTTSPPCHCHPAAPHQEAQQCRTPPGRTGRLPSGCLCYFCRCCFERSGTLTRVPFTIRVSNALIAALG